MVTPYSQSRRVVDILTDRPDLEVDGFTFSPEQLTEELYIVPEIVGEVLPEDIIVVDGEEMLSSERSLLDLALCTRAVDFWQMIDRCLGRGLTTPDRLRRAIARYPEHKGGPRLELFLKEWSGCGS